MSEKNARGRFLIAIGAVLVVAALSLVFYNFYHENASRKSMNEAFDKLKSEIPVHTGSNDSPFDVFDDGENAPQEDDTLELDGKLYMGIIDMPSLNQQFPVIKNWSYPDMNIAPCRYDGTRAGRDFIICAHNYAGFFDKLDQLVSGDEIIFTDIHGKSYSYTVSYSELISGWNLDAMYKGAAEDWDLTLFTCTWSGYSRVTVRCVASDK